IYSKLVFSKRIIHHVNTRASPCRTQLTPEMSLTFRTNETNVYTQALCIKYCQQLYIHHHCQCIEPYAMMFLRSSTVNVKGTITSAKLCNLNETCLKNVKQNFSSNKCTECLPECETFQYNIQTSYAQYPNSKSYGKVLKSILEHFKDDNRFLLLQGKRKNCREIIQDNVVAVEITAGTYGTEILTETLMVSWTDLISSIGGQTGLWIGAFGASISKFDGFFLEKRTSRFLHIRNQRDELRCTAQRSRRGISDFWGL
ncbi:unnamed protein product, partial [Didymodactylos carnosus]